MATNVLNTKICKVKNKIPDHFKYNTTQEFSTSTTENFEARLKQADLLKKTDFVNKLKALINELPQLKQNI